VATAAKYPAALLTLANVGGEMGGIVTAILSGQHSATVTTITLTATVPTTWPTTGGWVTIDSEIIQYAGVSGSTLTGCTRAAQTAYGGGAAAIHNDQSVVGFYLTPQAVNQIIADLIAVETLLGVNGVAVGSHHTGTASWTPGVIAAGGFANVNVAVTCAFGDTALGGFSLPLPAGMTISAWVIASNTVQVVLYNSTGASQTIGAGTVRADTWNQ